MLAENMFSMLELINHISKCIINAIPAMSHLDFLWAGMIVKVVTTVEWGISVACEMIQSKETYRQACMMYFRFLNESLRVL